MRTEIKHPQLLQIQDGDSVSFGAWQEWYPGWWQRLSGCGPTAASTILWYLAAARPAEYGALFRGQGTRRADMQQMMECIWNYVTPGLKGVNKASIFTDGVKRYAKEQGVALTAQVLAVPENEVKRPNPQTVYQFLSDAFTRDLPVAFLNLSNGAVRNLDSWHWVTLVSTDEKLQAQMYDQSRRQLIDLALWLETTAGGGAFVVIE